ncbi:uncharacterized protein LOC142549272 [Primulina tabacum]|uniref:uncharacterized protein LOC142549272 n=1 Tax=Primulina tabacum TaxID=48773 RepID=UPI003F5A6406
MKSLHIFCASPASTAICSNTDSRAIHPQDLRRKDHQLNQFNNSHKPPKYEAPCSSRLPLDPIMPFYTRKSTSSSSSSAKKTDKILRRKSSADASDLSSSSRYLLSEKPFLDFLPESGRAVVSRQLRRDDNLCNIKYERLNSDGYSGFKSFSSHSTESPVFRPSSTSSNAASPQVNLDSKLNSRLNVLESPPVPSNHQVVELMVSIHCKGCEGKLRKHIAKMEGKIRTIQNINHHHYYYKYVRMLHF